MKKKIGVLLTALTCLAAMPVSANAASEVYTAQSVYIEEAYAGDCWNGVSESLTLNEDGTYVRTENTSIIQVSGVIVTYWTYTMNGTYTAEDDGEGTKTVTLSAPTSVLYVMNDAATTSEEDDSLLEYAGETTLELNTETLKYTVE